MIQMDIYRSRFTQGNPALALQGTHPTELWNSVYLIGNDSE